MPWTDPQFYLVTAAAVVGVWRLWREVAPRDAKGACGGCASGAAASARATRAAQPLVQLGGGSNRPPRR
ncbi:MAG: hypothetical protein AAGN46_03015 [Acidobacteriota bacterium]